MTTMTLSPPVARALADMNVPLRKVRDEILKHVQMLHSEEILHRYDVGLLIEQVSADVEKYGENAVDKLAASLGEKATTLWDFRRLATNYGRNELERLTSGDNGRLSVSYTHLIEVVVLDKPQRDKLLGEIVATAMPVAEMRQRLAQLSGRARGSGGKIKAPASVRAGLLQIRKFAEDMTTRTTSVWQQHVFERLSQMPSDQLDTDTLRDLDSCGKALDLEREAIDTLLRNVNGARTRVQRVVETRKEDGAAEAPVVKHTRRQAMPQAAPVRQEPAATGSSGTASTRSGKRSSGKGRKLVQVARRKSASKSKKAPKRKK